MLHTITLQNNVIKLKKIRKKKITIKLQLLDESKNLICSSVNFILQ